MIRGIECSKDTPKDQLLHTFDQIRTFIGIDKEEELIPIHAEVLESQPEIKAKSVVFKLKSIEAKRSLLLARRSKFDIRPSDIKLTQSCNNPLIVSEQLTRKNQELLYKARSLRDSAGFKYVWSCNGQILARKRNRERVIRILDENQIEQLRVQSLDEVKTFNGQSYASRHSRITSSNPQI